MMLASFQIKGNTEEDNEAFMIKVMAGSRDGKISPNILELRPSQPTAVDLISRKALETSSTVTAENENEPTPAGREASTAEQADDLMLSVNVTGTVAKCLFRVSRSIGIIPSESEDLPTPCCLKNLHVCLGLLRFMFCEKYVCFERLQVVEHRFRK
jgi:hypothetical protein